MSKIERLKKELEDIYNEKTGAYLDPQEIIKKVLSCKKDDNKNRQRQGLKKLKDLGKNKRRFTKEKEGRLFGMIYEFDYSDKHLSIEEEGVYSILRKNMVLDGTGFVVISGVHSRQALAKHCNISKNKISKILNLLQDKELIKIVQVGKSVELYINPYYYRVSRWCAETTIALFNLPLELFDT